LSARDPVLEVRNLTVDFARPGGGVVRAVDGVSFDLAHGETLALVGPSGCGKSTVARAMLRLCLASAGEILLRRDAGSAAVDMMRLEGRELREARRAIGIVFQDPFASLNPRMRVAPALDEVQRVHGLARSHLELLDAVGLPRATAERFPHELSGGQRQRVALARALAAQPSVLVCDEILSALDVSIQAQILELLARLKLEERLTMLFISHDRAVVELVADRVATMRGGRLEGVTVQALGGTSIA
jgi:peptide/nickel transport system ATP-binding protein